ncbi:MAG: hypothetical protein KJN79_09420 [Gammaproteobacteria bacterium]|nr:hypothetical protein [Gammaproteobacteria bacterium]
MNIEKTQDAIARHLAAGSVYLAVSTMGILINELTAQFKAVHARLDALEAPDVGAKPHLARELQVPPEMQDGGQ